MSDSTQPDSGLRWTLFGRLTMTAANGVLMLAAALFFMDEASFGWFATAIGAQLLGSRLILLGLDQTIIRLFTSGTEDERQLVVQRGLAITLTLGVITILVSAPLPSLVPELRALIGFPAPGYLAAIGLGAAGTAWFDFGCAAHLARTGYRTAGIWLGGVPIVRTLVAVLVCAQSEPGSASPVVAFASVTVLASIALFMTLPLVGDPPVTKDLKPVFSGIGRVLRYTLWIGLGDAAAVLALHLGLFLLILDGQEAAAGRFAFALQIASVFFAAFVAFYQALLPRASRLPSVEDVRPFLRDTFRTGLKLGAVILVMALLAEVVLPPLLAELQPGMTGFGAGLRGLTLFTIVLVLEAPFGVTCHYLLRPRLQVAALWLRCLLIAGAGLWAAPRFGAAGAGGAQVFGATVAALCLAGLVVRAVQKQRDSVDENTGERGDPLRQDNA